MDISVVIITFNEAQNIGRTLEAAKQVATEIVVVDSFSQDHTQAICLKHGVNFIEHAFTGHIEQKNWAMAKASCPWILSIDADEVLSPALIQSIQSLNENDEIMGYVLNRSNNYCGKWIKHCGWYPDKKLRLVKSGMAHWTGTNPHDKLTLKKDGAKTEVLKGDLLHYAFHTEEQHLKQIDFFSKIKAEAAFEKGVRSTVIKRWIHPAFRFFKGYFLKLGFLDGYYGWVICRNTAYAEQLRYRLLKELWDQKN